MQKVDSYGLDPHFERSVAYHCANSKRFYGTVGHSVDPEALRSTACQLVVRAVKAIAKDTGSSPSHASVVMQRLQRWMGEGKITQEQVHDALDLFIEHDPAPIPEIIAELSPVIRRRMQAEAVKSAMEEHAKSGDFSTTRKLLTDAERLGVVDNAIGMRLGKSSFAEIQRLRHLDRLPTGILELDMILDGGMPRGTLLAFIAGSGGGKSMALCHATAHALKQGLMVVYATLELPEAIIMARVKANLTSVPTNRILHGDDEKAREAIDDMYPTLGTFIVKSFPAKVTTVPHVIRWIKEVEEQEDQEVGLVVIDYLGKMGSHDKNDKNDYSGQGTVWETMRLYVEDSGKWLFSADQAVRRAGKDRKRRIELDDISDSQHKARIADAIVTLNPDASGEQIDYFTAKFRYGESNKLVGPLPHDWGCARMTVDME